MYLNHTPGNWREPSQKLCIGCPSEEELAKLSSDAVLRVVDGHAISRDTTPETFHKDVEGFAVVETYVLL